MSICSISSLSGAGKSFAYISMENIGGVGPISLTKQVYFLWYLVSLYKYCIPTSVCRLSMKVKKSSYLSSWFPCRPKKWSSREVSTGCPAVRKKREKIICYLKAVFRIHDILVWIRIGESMPLTYGSGCGSGSCYFRHWPSRRQQKTNLKKCFSAYYFLNVHLHHF